MHADREGTFRGVITSPGLQKGKPPSKSVGVTFLAQLTSIWVEHEDGEGGEWQPWEEYGMEAEGTSWIVGKEGAANQKAIEALIACAGWDGDLNSIYDGSWVPTPCQFVIKADTYRDETRYKVAFVNDYNRVPGGTGNVDASEAKLLQSQLGQQFRAIAGSLKRNATAPAAGKPSSPPASKSKVTTPRNAPVSTTVDENGEVVVPF